MAQSSDSVVEVGKAQRSDSDWPKPGDEGFVHPDGTPQSERQLAENRQAAANRAAAGSGVHGAPGQGGVQPASSAGPDESELAAAQRDHTEWVQEGLAALGADDEPEGKHEVPKASRTEASS